MADPDFQIRGGGGGNPDPEITGGPGLQKIFFRPFGPHFGLKIRRGGGADPLGPSPGSAIGKYLFKALLILFFSFARNDVCLFYPLFSKSIFCSLISSTNTLNG